MPPKSHGPQLTLLSRLRVALTPWEVSVSTGSFPRGRWCSSSLPVCGGWPGGQVSTLCCVTVGRVTTPCSWVVGRCLGSPGERAGGRARPLAGCPQGSRLRSRCTERWVLARLTLALDEAAQA